ncbi:MAG TPA: murein biosynthesis integral membrane protein MurJ, partial [Oceanospirillaceae bacterium]|nr:murein biosynthesis integral membrane protein MurJ [Oceanospirillaceae bacterium]
MSDSDTSLTDTRAPNSFVRSSLVVATMTMLSRVLGLVRDIVIASVFGASNAADAFFVAFKIPNFLRRLFAEGAFNQAFVPVLAEVSAEQDRQALRNMVAKVSGTLLLILSILTIVAVLAAPLLVWVFAPGFAKQPEKMALTADMLRLTFPYLLLISMTGFFGSLLNHARQFAIPALTPVFLNLSLIGAAWWLAPKLAMPITALAWGVLVAGGLQLLLQLPFVGRLGLLVRPQIGFADSRVKQVMKLMLPALFGVSVAQINLLLDTLLASLLQPGSVSWLYYSDRLMELPLGVFGIAIATVILP